MASIAINNAREGYIDTTIDYQQWNGIYYPHCDVTLWRSTPAGDYVIDTFSASWPYPAAFSSQNIEPGGTYYVTGHFYGIGSATVDDVSGSITIPGNPHINPTVYTSKTDSSITVSLSGGSSYSDKRYCVQLYDTGTLKQTQYIDTNNSVTFIGLPSNYSYTYYVKYTGPGGTTFSSGVITTNKQGASFLAGYPYVSGNSINVRLQNNGWNYYRYIIQYITDQISDSTSWSYSGLSPGTYNLSVYWSDTPTGPWDGPINVSNLAITGQVDFDIDNDRTIGEAGAISIYLKNIYPSGASFSYQVYSNGERVNISVQQFSNGAILSSPSILGGVEYWVYIYGSYSGWDTRQRVIQITPSLPKPRFIPNPPNYGYNNITGSVDRGGYTTFQFALIKSNGTDWSTITTLEPTTLVNFAFGSQYVTPQTKYKIRVYYSTQLSPSVIWDYDGYVDSNQFTTQQQPILPVIYFPSTTSSSFTMSITRNGYNRFSIAVKDILGNIVWFKNAVTYVQDPVVWEVSELSSNTPYDIFLYQSQTPTPPYLTTAQIRTGLKKPTANVSANKNEITIDVTPNDYINFWYQINGSDPIRGGTSYLFSQLSFGTTYTVNIYYSNDVSYLQSNIISQVVSTDPSPLKDFNLSNQTISSIQLNVNVDDSWRSQIFIAYRYRVNGASSWVTVKNLNYSSFYNIVDLNRDTIYQVQAGFIFKDIPNRTHWFGASKTATTKDYQEFHWRSDEESYFVQGNEMDMYNGAPAPVTAEKMNQLINLVNQIFNDNIPLINRGDQISLQFNSPMSRVCNRLMVSAVTQGVVTGKFFLNLRDKINEEINGGN